MREIKFRAWEERKKRMLYTDDYTLKEYEIIGNIYENPKLLEG